MALVQHQRRDFSCCLRCLGWHFQGQLIYDPSGVVYWESRKNLARLRKWALTADKVYNAEELAWQQFCLVAAWHYPWNFNGRCAVLWRRKDSKLGHFQPIPNSSFCGYDPYV